MTVQFDMIPLADLLRQSNVYAEIDPEKSYQLVTVKLWGKGVELRSEVEGTNIIDTKLFIARENQFILSKIDARNGAFGLIPPQLDRSVVSTDFPIFELNTEKILPDYLNWMSKTKEFVHLCAVASEGTTNRVRLKIDRFLASRISLPPLEEQCRIIARIEELAAKIEEAREIKTDQQEKTEFLFEAVLKHTRLSLLHSSPISKKKLGEITSVTSGGTPSRAMPNYWEGDIAWIKTGELLDNDIHQSEEYITEEGLEGSSAKIFPRNTILIALYGQGQTRGRTGRLMIEATTNQACCAILPNPLILNERFTQYWLRSLYTQMRQDAHGGAQPNWNSQTIKNIEIPLLSLEDQKYLVSYFDSVQTQINLLNQQQTQTSAELNALLPSILDKAFKGEL